MNLCIAHGGDMGEPSGGTDRVSAIAAGLQQRGFDVTLVIPAPSDELTARLGSVEVVEVPTPVGGSIARASSVVRAARRIARERDAHLQVEHSSLAGIGTLHGLDGYVLDMHDVAYARFDHVDVPAAGLLRGGLRWLESRAIDRADHLVVVSETMYELLRSEWNVPPEAMTIVPNGFFPETVGEQGRATAAGNRVTFFGTLHPKVDVAALRAVAELPSVDELVVIGDGAQRDRLDRLAEANEAVHVTGRLPDAEAFELLASSAVLINPQTASDIQRASSPVKLYYYAALGKPMVVTAGPSVVDYLVRRGAATTAYATETFVDRVRAVLADDDLAGRLAENALTVSEQFRWSARITDLEQLYGRLRSGY